MGAQETELDPRPLSHLPGYVHFRRVGQARLISQAACAPALHQILQQYGTLHEYASQIPGVHAMQGRGPVYALTLPGECGEIVVRHSMRGGLMAKVNRDRYLFPAPVLRELVTAMQLRQFGIPTPEVIAFATYRTGFLMRRADVVTRYIPGFDLAAVLAHPLTDAQRVAAWDATAALIRALGRVGAHHQDLNLKNVLLVERGNRFDPYVLDVDRIRLNPPSPLVLEANVRRFSRSLEKFRTQRGLPVTDWEIAYFMQRVQE